MFSNRQCHYNNKRMKTTVGKLLAALNTEMCWLLYTFNLILKFDGSIYVCSFMDSSSTHSTCLTHNKHD